MSSAMPDAAWTELWRLLLQPRPDAFAELQPDDQSAEAEADHVSEEVDNEIAGRSAIQVGDFGRPRR
jgi:hypothetical protein